jgi:hypothetical protein
MTKITSHIQVVYWTPIPNMCHPTPFSSFFCIHVLGGVDEGLQVSILLYVCVAIVWEAPNVQTKCPRVAKINLKLTIPNEAFTFLIFIL